MLELSMIVEIPKFSSNKFEYDQKTKKFVLDRTLTGAMYYPEEYGFIEETLDFDGDALDVVCITKNPTFVGCILPIKVIGILKMLDNGERDDKIIAVNKVEKRLKHIDSINNLEEAKKEELIDFFLNYKNLENKKIKIEKFENEEEAIKTIKKCKSFYKKYENLIKDKKIEKKELTEILKKEEKI